MSGAIYDAMTVMFVHAKDSMSVHELKELSMLSDQAIDEARRFSQICEGIGMLIASDGSCGAGVLQDRQDVPTLLYSLSHAFDTIAGMVDVSLMADGLISRREGMTPPATEHPATTAKGGKAK